MMDRLIHRLRRTRQRHVDNVIYSSFRKRSRRRIVNSKILLLFFFFFFFFLVTSAIPSIHLAHCFHPARQISGFCVNPPNASSFVRSNRKIMTGCRTIRSDRFWKEAEVVWMPRNKNRVVPSAFIPLDSKTEPSQITQLLRLGQKIGRW